MKKRRATVNGALRQWARGVSFTIAMGRRQVYMLVSTHLSADRTHGKYGHEDGFLGDSHRHMRHFVTSMHCLVDRGLIEAPVWDGRLKRNKMGGIPVTPIRECWRLTRAGELVIELLKEAGIYGEVHADLEDASRPKLRIA